MSYVKLFSTISMLVFGLLHKLRRGEKYGVRFKKRKTWSSWSQQIYISRFLAT